jgi:hypothetical protein
MQELRTSYEKLSLVMRPGSTLLNADPSSNQWQSTTDVASSGKIVATVSWDEKDIILVHLLPGTALLEH